MAPDFQITRNRDAWGAVRGFVYQVQHTILRWLELAFGTALEPEHGEDIDVVISAMTPGADTDRILQQIKYRERDITLNSPSVRAALAGFFEHTRSNPQLVLQFQFITNAQPTSELRSYFPMRLPGLKAWDLVNRAREPIGTTEQDYLNAIRRTILDARRPQDYPEAEWSDFQRFWKDCTPAELFAFVRRVEIKCGEPEPADLTDHIRAALVAQGRCADQNLARAAYERLFCFVFDVLARPGPRRLAPEDLATALTATPLTAAQEVLVSQLRAIAESVAELEPRVQQLESKIAAAFVEMEVLGGELRLANALEVIAEPPPQPTQPVERHSAIAQLTALLASRSFVALHGTPGCGKTQLARATAAAAHQVRAWISLSGYDATNGAHYLALFRARLLTDSRSVTPEALIVVDDIPATPLGSTLAAAIIALHRRATQLGCRTLCISEHRILTTVASGTLGSTAELECPPLTDDEILRMLKQRGAPAELLSDGWVTFFAGVTHRHMLLFVAMLAHLTERSWQVNRDALTALLGGEFTRGLAPAVSERLFRSVPDERTRELLHRVRLATGPITESALLGLADAPMRVPEPLLRIAPIDGIWLLRDSKRRLAISPLARALPSATLPAETTRSCHSVLADALLEPKGISPLDAKRALVHLGRAMRWRQHDALLTTFLASALSNRKMAGAEYLLADLASHAISDAAPDDERIGVLALQFAALRGQGKRCERILGDLSPLIGQRTLPDLRVATAAGLVGQHLRGRQQIRYVSLMIRAIGADALDEVKFWKALLAISGMRLDSDEAALAWATTLVSLPRQHRDALLSNDPTFVSIVISLCTGIWTRATNHEANAVDAIAQKLDGLRSLGRSACCPLLECAAASAMILVLVDGVEKRYEDADDIASSAIAVGVQDSRGRFLVYSAVAFSHKLRGELVEAVNAYSCAFEGSVSGLEYDAVWASMLAAEAAAEQPEVATTFLEKGALATRARVVSGSREGRVCTPLITAKVLLELGLARWLAGSTAWHTPFLEGVALVLFERVDSDNWRSIVVRLSHCLGYIVAKVVHGHEVTRTSDGSLYRKPWIGMFRARDEEIVTAYSSAREVAVAAHAVALSHHAGNPQQALRFLRHALDLAYDPSDTISAAGLTEITGYLLAEDLVEDVLRAAFVLGTRARHSLADAAKGGWQECDQAVALLAFIPVILRIAIRLMLDRLKGLEFLGRVIEAVLQLDTDARSGRPWSTVARSIEIASNGGGTLEEDGKSLGSVTGPVASIIYHGCLLLMSVHPRSTPGEAALFQALTMPTVWRMIDRDPSSQDLLLCEFVRVYWQDAVTNSRFVASTEVAHHIRRAATSGTSAYRIAGILDAVWKSLQTPVPSETRQWIDGLLLTARE